MKLSDAAIGLLVVLFAAAALVAAPVYIHLLRWAIAFASVPIGGATCG